MKWLTRVGLSALTFMLGGLVVGQGAHAQDQIPAPNLYDGATDCTTAIPTQVTLPTRFSTSTRLDDALKDYPEIATPGNLVGVVEAGTACDRNAVGSQFDKAKSLYDDAAAARTLTVGEDPDPVAVENYVEKKAARDAFGGPVFEALYTQYDRQATARKAITDYNDVVRATTGTYSAAKATYDAIAVRPGTGASENPDLVGYTADTGTPTAPNDDEVIGDFGGRRGVEGFQDIAFDASVTGFVAGVGTGSTTEAAVGDDGEFSSVFLDALDGAFTTGGTLKKATTTTGSGATAVTTATVSGDIVTLGNIASYLDQWNDIVDAAAKHVAEGTRNEVTNLPELQETLRRVTAARDYVSTEQRRLTNVIRAKNYSYNHDSDDGTTPEVTVTSVLRTYDTEIGKRRSAADRVRSAVTQLENARNAVHDAMKAPGTFLQQVVDLRQYEKDAADALAAEFDEGEAPESVTKAAEDAGKALMRAQGALQAHQDLVGDETNPASVLLQALLEDETLPNGMDNPADDDGQALIDAISTTYSTAKDAKDAADAAKAATDGLTGEDGKIAEIEMKLMQKKEYIDNLAGEIGMDPVTGEGTADDMGNTRIDLNEARSMANAANIATNTGNIAMNAENIAGNAMNIMENRGMIETNTAAIGANAAMLMDHAGMISANASAISANSSTLSMHTQQISGLVDEMEVVKAGVAAGIAMASMPAVQGNGVSLGVGSFDGESAFAVGYQYGGERINFQIGVSSSGGETGAGAGISFAIGQ